MKNMSNNKVFGFRNLKEIFLEKAPIFSGVHVLSCLKKEKHPGRQLHVQC